MEIKNYEFESIRIKYADILSRQITKGILIDKLNIGAASFNALYYATIIAIDELRKYFDIDYQKRQFSRDVIEYNHSFAKYVDVTLFNNSVKVITEEKIEILYRNTFTGKSYYSVLDNESYDLFSWLEECFSKSIKNGDLHLEHILMSELAPLKNLIDVEHYDEIEIYD